jgi:phosphate transport system permease protein
MNPNTLIKRKWQNHLMQVSIILFGSLMFIPLILILFYLLAHGIDTMSFNFFMELPLPAGETGGGMLHALLGTIYLVILSGLMAIPIGIIGGITLSEYANLKSAKALRFVIELLNSTPSIVIGIFVYSIIVKPTKTFSAISGAVALAVVILPIIVKTVEEILRLIPQTIREAGLGLGLPKWKVVLFILLWPHRNNFLPGILLSLARSSGETAPLLFTAFGSMYLSFSLNAPMAALPLEIYNYAISPYKDWHQLAWTGSLVLILLVFALNISAKVMLGKTLNNKRK